MSAHFLACDLGAESGRLMLGTLDGSCLDVQEVHRFPNTPIKSEGSLCWNVPNLFAEIKVMVPPKPTKRERELFEQLAAVSTFDPRRER